MNRLKLRSKLSQTPPRTLAQRFIEESLRHEEHPLIEFVNGPAGRRASIRGGMDVWQMVCTIKSNDGNLDEVEAYHDGRIPRRQIEAAWNYYHAHPDEIDAWIEANDEAFAEGLRNARPENIIRLDEPSS